MFYIKVLLCLLIILELMDMIVLKKLLHDIHPRPVKVNIRPYLGLGLGVLMMVISLPLTLFLVALWIVHRRQDLYKRKKRKAKVIAYYGYKIFKFLINQTSSGIKVSDALQDLYQIVDDEELRQHLIDVSACYGHTADLHQALDVLKVHYKGVEVQTLCVAIQQGIDTGCNYETLIKMEGLLFKKYIYQIQKDTILRKKRGVLATLYLCIIVVLMVAVPIVLDMLTAFDKIFY